MPTKDLTVAIRSTFDGKGTTAAEKGLAQSEEKAKGFEKALKGQEEQAKRSERALGQYEAQLKRNAAQLDAVGSSALRTRRLLEDATKRLPKLDIEADLSQPERQLAALTDRLRELSGKKLGIDIDARDAERQVAEIRRELMTLASDHPKVVVAADAERAISALERVEREARKVDGRVAKIRVEVDGDAAAARLKSAFGDALGTLQQMAPKSAATAVAAIAALPPAATVASAAIVATLGGALAGLGLAASKGSDAAQAALAHLKEFAKAEAKRMGEPFERVWVSIVAVAERELANLSPVVRDALEDLAPDVMTFVDQTGSSLEELEPAIGAIQRAFSAVLKELGPEMPRIMQYLASAITEVASAVEENPDVIVKMVVNLAALVEWAAKAGAALTRLTDFVLDNWGAVKAIAGAMGIVLPDLVEMGAETGKAAKRLEEMGGKADEAAERLGASARATEEQAEAAKRMKESWSQAYAQFVDVLGAIDQAKAKASAQDKLTEASQRLAEVQRAGAEKIKRAQAEVAQAHEQAAERITAAQDRVSAARERATEQAEQSQARIRAAQEALAAAVEQAAQREADAQAAVEEARRRAQEVAADSARSIEGAARQVADAQADAAARELDAARRVRDSHARTVEAVQDLEAAYASARRRVEELADAQAEGATDEESAQIALERARERLAELQAQRGAPDSKVTGLDIREAENSLKRAEQSLDRVRDRNAELAQEIEQANRDGIEGSAEVVAAKARIAEAQQAEQEAEAALARQRAENARTVADAEQALSDTRARAARAQEESERALARAQAELDQTRRDNAADVQRAQDDVATATREAAKAAQESARDIAAAQAEVAKASRDGAREVAEAEAKVRQARQDAAGDAIAAADAVRKAWSDLRGDSALTTEELFKQLQEQVAAQDRWQANMISLAGRVPEGVLEHLRQMGPMGAREVERVATMSDPELQKYVALVGRRSKEAADAFAEKITEAGPVLAAIAKNNGQKVADQIRQAMLDKRLDVHAAARELGLQIDQGLDIGRTRVIKIDIGTLDELIREKEEMQRRRETGGIDRYAAGGLRSVGPMITSRPTVLFGEGRDDEAFIPYDVQYRRRAEALLGQVAGDFGGLFLKPLGALSMMPLPAQPRGAGSSAVPARGGVTIEHFHASVNQDPRDIAEQFYLLSIARGY